MKYNMPTNMDGMSFTGSRTQYSLRSRAERLISAGRLVLAVFFLLAIWLDPTQPIQHAKTVHTILLGYLGYALVLAAALWNWDVLGTRSKIITHILDLVIFSFLMDITEGPASPFFVYFVFLLVCATVRWQWQGTLWTAVVAISAVLFMAWYPENRLSDPQFEMNRFIIRVAYLAVVAVLLGYMGAHEHNLRSRLSKLAAWPHSFPAEFQPFLREILEHSAEILCAPRMLVIWEEKEEPVLHSALWSSGEFTYLREPFSSTESLVAEPLIDGAFFCSDTRKPRPTMVNKSPGGLQRWQGAPLRERIQERFDIGAVLSVPLRGEHYEGYLMALDMTRMTSDDLALGNIIAHEATTRLDHFFLLQKLRNAAVSEERVCLARDLHDGLLQSLAGAALQLQTVHRLIKDDPQAAMQRLLEIQQLIAAEQRDLRSHILHLRPSTEGAQAIVADLGERLAELAERMKRHRGLRVDLRKDGLGPGISGILAQEIYFIAHESLINAARHAAASAVQIELSTNNNEVHIVVADNGKGFPFHGSFVLEDLIRRNLGPVTIKERVSALGGNLSIESGNTGTKLEISLPLTEYRG